MERRAIAESALRHLCDRMGVPYGKETAPQPGAWFLDTVHRNCVNIYQWGDSPGQYGVSSPLGSYGKCSLTSRFMTGAGSPTGVSQRPLRFIVHPRVFDVPGGHRDPPIVVPAATRAFALVRIIQKYQV